MNEGDDEVRKEVPSYSSSDWGLLEFRWRKNGNISVGEVPFWKVSEL